MDAIGVDAAHVSCVEDIPYLPVSFFKTHKVVSGEFEPELVFESSGTTGAATSRHWVKKAALYEASFLKTFRLFYHGPSNWSVIGLLPGYLERQNASLVYMVNTLIRESGDTNSGFYLHDHDRLYQTLAHNEITGRPTLLIGVTFALLDFSRQHPMKLKHTLVVETGGMKGRSEELTREDVHTILKQNLGVKVVHSEYGMTELLSQAYSQENGLFHCPSWMKVVLREYNDPFAITAMPEGHSAGGLINIADLANIYSCSFIATDDVGRLYKDGTFEVLGRRDSSDLRGCSLLSA